jgi:hypothetical protein
MSKKYISPAYFRDKNKMSNLAETLEFLEWLCQWEVRFEETQYSHGPEYIKASRKLKRLVDNLAKYLQNERVTKDY